MYGFTYVESKNKTKRIKQSYRKGWLLERKGQGIGEKRKGNIVNIVLSLHDDK